MQVVNLTTNNSYFDGNVQNGGAYYYLVSAFNILGDQSPYSAEVIARPASTTVQPLGYSQQTNGLQINWPADHMGWRLLMSTNVLAAPSAWFFVPASNATNQVWLPFDSTQSSVFFRLVYP